MKIFFMFENFPADGNREAPAENAPLHQGTEGVSAHQRGAQCLVLGFAQPETENRINTLVPQTFFFSKALTDTSHPLVRQENLADAHASSDAPHLDQLGLLPYLCSFRWCVASSCARNS